jgi:signal peptidase II
MNVIAARFGQSPWLLLSVIVLGLDQLTKAWVTSALQLYERLPVLPPLLEITRLHNRGAAFSFLNDASGWQHGLFLSLAATVTLGIVVWLLRMGPTRRIVPAGLALIAGGAVGNAIDRLHFGYVVDFIHVHWRDVWWFPAFNVADSAITVGAVLLIIDAWLDTHPRAGSAR